MKSQALVLDASPSALLILRARYEAAIDGATRKAGETPEMVALREALAALPDLRAFLRVIPEIRETLVDACADAGIPLPDETRQALGIRGAPIPSRG